MKKSQMMVATAILLLIAAVGFGAYLFDWYQDFDDQYLEENNNVEGVSIKSLEENVLTVRNPGPNTSISSVSVNGTTCNVSTEIPNGVSTIQIPGDCVSGVEGITSIQLESSNSYASATLQQKLSVYSGQFVDSAVSGLEYTTSGGKSGLTDSGGFFMYSKGEEVTFAVGNITLGSAEAQDVLNPSDLTGKALTDRETVNMARFLLTIDDDDDTSNGIQITEAIRNEAEDMSINFDVPLSQFLLDIQAFINTLTSVSSAGSRTLTSPTLASSHLNATITNIESGQPSVSLDVNATTVAPGGSLVLSWSTREVSSCSASGDWSGSKSLEGEQTLSGLTSGAKTYQLTCDGVSDSVTVSVVEQVTDFVDSFESWPSGTSLPPEGWTTIGSTSASQSTSNVIDGNYSVQTSYSGGSGISQNFILSKYSEVKAYLGASGGGVSIEVNGSVVADASSSASGVTLSGNIANYTGNNSILLYTNSYTMPEPMVGEGSNAVWDYFRLLKTPAISGTLVHDSPFNNVSSASLSSTITSQIQDVTYINDNTAVSISGSGSPEFRICDDSNCNTVNHGWTSGDGSIASDEYIQLRLTSSPDLVTSRNATLSIGDYMTSWSVTTTETYVDSFESWPNGVSSLPEGWNFTNPTYQTVSRNSNNATDGTYSIDVDNGNRIAVHAEIEKMVNLTNVKTVSVDLLDTYQNARLQIYQGGTLVNETSGTTSIPTTLSINTSGITGSATIRLKSAENPSDNYAGATWDHLVVSTYDRIPNAFDLGSFNCVAADSSITSQIVQVTGIENTTSVMVSGHSSFEYRVCEQNDCSGTGTAAYTSAYGEVSKNQYVQARIQSPPINTPSNEGTLIIGGVEDSMSVNTCIAPP